MITLDNKGFVIVGLRGSGKTELAKHILRSTKRHLVYDPLNEYPGFNRYVPDSRNDVAEFDEMVNGMVIEWKPRLFLVDEANRYVRPKPSPLPQGAADLVDLARHWDVSFGMITRRPTQFHTDIVELADYLFIFNLPGKNDRAWLNEVSTGMGDVAATLPKYHFLVVDQRREYFIHPPVALIPNK